MANQSSFAVSHIPLLRLQRGQSRRLRAETSQIEFGEHWLCDRNQLCAEENCPACELWAAKRRVMFIGTLARRDVGPARVAVVLPAESLRRAIRPGRVYDVTRLTAEMRVEELRDESVTELPVTAVWCVLAQIYRLPPPTDIGALLSGEWWRRARLAAEGRLRGMVIR